jgi:SAM-dependent methyltransferase
MNRVLDLGCGNNPIDEAVGVDLLPYNNVNIVADALSLPFKKETFERVNASQLLEHLDGHEELPTLFEEVWRVLTPKGTFSFDVPIGSAWNSDPTHKTKWQFKTIVYFLNRQEVERLGWDPTTFPDYYASREFEFELENWNCEAWLRADTLPLRALSLIIRKASNFIRTDKWSELPLGAGNINITLKKCK